MTAAVACPECQAPVFADDRFCGSCGAPQASLGGVGTSTERAAKLLAELRALTAGEYEIRGEIGRGGMAVVYLAYDLRLNRRVAIKAMLPDLAFHDGMEERFKREARTAARLDHPNIVVIHSVRDSGDPLFFVMKYVDGASLDAVIRTHGALPIHVVQGVLVQLCSALQYAHSDGVVHRDVKPANILVDTRGTVQVTDFGIAKAADSANLTRTGLAIGTPTYMCPEQCMGHPQTPASDQYSLGIVAYELLTGNPPFVGTGIATQWSHIQDVAKPLAEVRPDCPEPLATAVMRMIAKDPKDRWPALRDAVPLLSRGLPAEADSGRPALADLVRRTNTTRPAFAVTPPSPVPHRQARPAEPPIVSGPRTPVARAEIKTIEVVPSRCSLETGTTQVVRCRALDARGKELTASPEWSSSNPEIASVDDSGTVTAHSPGSVTIAAMVDDMAGMSTVDVSAAQVTRVDVEPSIVSLPQHGVVKLTVRAYSAKGKQVTRPTVTFRTSDPAVATISADGSLTGLARGQTTAIASVGGVDCKIIITVTAAVASSLGITPANPSVVVGAELALSASASDAGGHRIGDQAVTWRSLTPSVAKVSARGRVMAKQPGTAMIVAEYDGLEARTEVTVTAAGAQRSYAGLVVAIAVMGLVGVGIWQYRKLQSSAASAPTTAASSGAVAAQTPEPAAPPAPAPVVPAVPLPVPADTVVASIQLTGKSPVVAEVGDTLALGVRPANRRGQAIPNVRIEWEASNPAVGTVDSTGAVTTISVGRTLITARAAGRERVIAVDVRAATPVGITMVVGRDSLEVGDTTIVKYKLFDKRDAAVDEPVTWKSSNATVASVDEAGVVHALAVGQASIAASSGNITDSIRVYVAPARPTVSDAGLDSARLATSSVRAIAPNRPSARGVAPRTVGALPAGVRAPTDAEAKTIADSIVMMIGRRVVRVAQLTKAQGEPGDRFVKFLDRETPAVRLVGVPVIGESRATGSRVALGVVLEWRTFTQSKRERTVNLEGLVEPVRGGWVIRELRFPTGFAP